ncbi:DUF2314 domain-containing protein [Hyalangium sp.]|uniref:DUF2314 domain-containing protein n=1 Tax=Hyalangium sp. TaxID=2028555 RepID=UPI002D518F35|nr:DUF2314 domain-containing protein [Hyalangium sp.]HYH96330.1 DUF2314 domain-containing protein [Hyalangium sp.]
MPLTRAPAARWLFSLLWLALAPLAYADKDKAAAQPPKPAARTFPRAQLRSPEILWTVLLFHPSPPPEGLVASARKLLAAKYPQLNLPQVPGKPRPEAIVEPARHEDLDPIDEDLLPYIARSLGPEERKNLLKARQATVLSFRVPFEQRHEALLLATRFAHQLASEHGALLWDSETREYFSPRSWSEDRLEGWRGGPPFVPAHIVMHVYREGETLRLVSLGMAKLGLPDLVVEQVPQSLSNEVGRLVNSVAQLLAEGLVLGADGTLDVDLSKLKDGKLRGQLEARIQKGAPRRVKLQALEARRDQGDPDNPLLELGFPGTGELQARQVAALDALFGRAPDPITPVAPGDPELEAVAVKARARLVELRARVDRGLRPPEQLLLKAGFRTDDGNTEFMWFEVTSWEAGKWRGALANEPQDVSQLRLGSTVSVPEPEVVDYVYMSPGGVREGGESSLILMRRQGH